MIEGEQARVRYVRKMNAASQKAWVSKELAFEKMSIKKSNDLETRMESKEVESHILAHLFLKITLIMKG